ncbi:sensor histidine kinase [Marinilabilia rubra]|uniref:Histidine kinase n=1 Tax=Marinilabilia rubra TaxID=2162893 RepID=A0A2U2B3H5_9BACT|nr:histidine kinase [Marinilabilia rubra]PWD97615.1 histidine kinase [Marinilabilia rubra]
MNFIKKHVNNWKVGVAFSALLPLFAILNQSENQTAPFIESFLTAWLVSFSFLMIAWFLNSKLTNLIFHTSKKWNLASKILIIFLFNGLLISLLIILNSAGAESINDNRESSYLFIFIRGSVSIAIIFLIQYALNLNARNQSVSLQNQMLKTENIRAQFEILRQQISPHFLFNSLSTLRSMIRSSNNNAEEFVIKLSDIYRLLLLKKERDTVTLKEELELIDDYSFLLFARYEDMLSIDIDIPENLLNYNIPTFSLQLLLENCVKHNIVSKGKPLHIKIYVSGINSVTVENNLQQKVASGDDSGLGLQNLIKRYELLGKPEGVNVFSDESVFRVKIKLLGR